MRLTDTEIHIPAAPGHAGLLAHLTEHVTAHETVNAPGTRPLRFAVVATDSGGYACELGTIEAPGSARVEELPSIFDFRQRGPESAGSFNIALMIPTGVGASLGGHSGDAGPLARLFASVCDTLITHPNVVNAADINVLPDNGLYVEGSALTRLMMGTAGLQRVRANRVLLVADAHPCQGLTALPINAASAARASAGIAIPEVVQLDPPLPLTSRYATSGAAVGGVEQFDRLLDILDARAGSFDAIALSTIIEIDLAQHAEYLDARGAIVNPWGGVEAILTHAVTLLYGMPSAHSPQMTNEEMFGTLSGAVDPRMAAEEVSAAFLHCVLSGLSRAPRLVTDPGRFDHPEVLSAENVSALVIPDGCLGLPVLAAIEQGIPVVAVRENTNRMRNPLTALAFAPGQLHIVDTYLEAVGVCAALRAGVAVDTVRRPLSDTRVVRTRASVTTTSD